MDKILIETEHARISTRNNLEMFCKCFFEKLCKIHRKIPVLESFLMKFEVLRHATLLKHLEYLRIAASELVGVLGAVGIRCIFSFLKSV